MKVLPVINVAPGNDEVVIDRLDAVRDVAQTIHLDVCDGTFTGTTSWADPQKWKEYSGSLKLQAHLMVNNPESVVPVWLAAGASEIIVHLETLQGDPDASIARMRALCEEKGATLVLAGGSGVSADELLAHAAGVNGLLLLAVKPGYSGQHMDEKVIHEKIDTIREHLAGIDLWIDGGVNEKTLPMLRASGANGAVAASAIFDAPSPVDAIAALQLL